MDDIEMASDVIQYDTLEEDPESRLRETCDGDSGFDDPHEHEDK